MKPRLPQQAVLHRETYKLADQDEAIAYFSPTFSRIHSSRFAIAWLGANNCNDPHPLTPSPHGEEGEPELFLLPSPRRRGVGGEVTTQIAPLNLLKSVRNASL